MRGVVKINERFAAARFALGHPGPVLVIKQGRFMTPTAPSLIEVRVELGEGRIVGLMAGDTALIGNVRQLDMPG